MTIADAILASRRPSVRVAWLAAAGLLTGCTVGPDYHAPTPASPGGFSSLQDVTQPLASTPQAAAADIATWWTVFADDTLTGLITRAASTNLTLAQANARVRQARASQAIAQGGLYPTVNADASASRGRTPGPGGGSTSNFFKAGFDASWELDVFGGQRRTIEAADASLTAAIESQRDAMVTLVAEIATTYLNLRGSQQELVTARRNLETQTQTLALTQERLEAGFVSALDVANARAQVASTTSRIPTLEAAVKADAYALGVLLGQDPGSLLAELNQTRSIPAAPSQVPVGLPSELLQRRPDVRQAEALLHAATARVGVATADLYPKFSLTAALGLESGKLSSLANAANRYWSLAPAASWTLFDGGKIRANIALEQAAADEALAVYKQTVLVSLQDVETALVSFVKEQERRVALTQSVDANREAVELSMLLYSNGRTDFLNVLSAQGKLLDAEDALTQSERAVSTDLVALYKALGGGWDAGTPGTQKPTESAK